MQSVLDVSNVYEKISSIEDSCHKALMGWITGTPELPARDIPVLHTREHPPKKTLLEKEGQARLLHDLANIELQAMELGLRTLIEFPEAPKQFREELTKITLEEGEHLKMCLDGIERLGFQWGDWPAHTGLWCATSDEDSILDRILIVHRYLEGSGLDAGETILNKLNSTGAKEIVPIVKRIFNDEIAHVQFGSRWYKENCKKLEIDPEYDFKERLFKIAHKVPNRLEKINPVVRMKAGFEDFEVQALVEFQQLQKEFISNRRLTK